MIHQIKNMPEMTDILYSTQKLYFTQKIRYGILIEMDEAIVNIGRNLKRLQKEILK